MKNTFKIALAFALAGMFALVTFADDKGNPAPAAATMSMEGTIIDADTQETLAGVTVKIAGTDVEVKTNLDGKFSIKGLTPGQYNLEVSYISYKDSQFVQTVSATDNTVKLSLETE